ncbi:MAG: hypothetical protein AAF355_13125 [Myxococcota bacterium]
MPKGPQRRKRTPKKPKDLPPNELTQRVDGALAPIFKVFKDYSKITFLDPRAFEMEELIRGEKPFHLEGFSDYLKWQALNQWSCLSLIGKMSFVQPQEVFGELENAQKRYRKKGGLAYTHINSMSINRLKQDASQLTIGLEELLLNYKKFILSHNKGLLIADEQLSSLHAASFRTRLSVRRVLADLSGNALHDEEVRSCEELISNVCTELDKLFAVLDEKLRDHATLHDIMNPVVVAGKARFMDGRFHQLIAYYDKELAERASRLSNTRDSIISAQESLLRYISGSTVNTGNISLAGDPASCRSTVVGHVNSARTSLDSISYAGIEASVETLRDQVDDALEATAAAKAADAAAAHTAFRRVNFTLVAQQAATAAANRITKPNTEPLGAAGATGTALTEAPPLPVKKLPIAATLSDPGVRGPRRHHTRGRHPLPVRLVPVDPAPSRAAPAPTDMLVHWGDLDNSLWKEGGRQYAAPLTLKDASQWVLTLGAHSLNKQRFIDTNLPVHPAMKQIFDSIPSDHDLHHCTRKHGFTVFYHKPFLRPGSVTVFAIGRHTSARDNRTYKLLVWAKTRAKVLRNIKLG